MVINTNLQALQASTRLAQSSSMMAQSLQRLSSGSKLTSPADDSAGTAVSMKLGAEMGRIDASSSNISNAISFSQTQDGYLQKVGDALNRMSELTVKAMDPTITDKDRADYNVEYQTLGDDLVKMSTAEFNGVPLFDGKSLPVTVDADANTSTFGGVDAYSFVQFTGHDGLVTAGDANVSLALVKDALNRVATYRAQVGTTEESLGFYNDQLTSLKTNLSAANSRITDVDVAQESTNYAKYNILTQAGTAMLAQANSLPQSVLKLLG
ncbi:MAG TPA: flagellin [Verrucomicrobiae bacterium]|nr:flagellin [Verrucomicrobiae bacterium]